MPTMSSLSRSLFKVYKQLLQRRPYLIQSIQTGTLMGAGDLISQTFVEGRSIYNTDFKRTAQFSSIGFFIGGPALTLWYRLLERYIGSKGKGAALKKVFVDQGLFAPSFLLVLMGLVGSVQGKSLSTIETEVRINYLDILKTNYMIWPWVQIINFYYVPLQYQVLLVQTVALFWNTYFSWKTNRKNDMQD